MSKYEWKELPDWKIPKDYMFLRNATAQEWAWEFLRRNDEYRSDWKSYFLETKGQSQYAKAYLPSKNADEDEQKWMRRVVTDGGDPIIRSLDRHLADKWSIGRMCDPMCSYAEGELEFKSLHTSPVIISDPEDLDDFVRIEEYEDGETRLVAPEFLVTVINLSLPLADQMKVLEKRIRSERGKRLDAGLIRKHEGYKNDPSTWLRHLRVLDARRTEPLPTHAQIANWLDDYDGNADPHKIGDKYYQAAKKLSRSGYRAAAIYEGTPSEMIAVLKGEGI